MESAVHEDAPASELARNLPELVAQLKALREDMARQTKLYDALLHDGAPRAPSAGVDASASLGASALDMSQSGMRGSIFTPFANSQLDPRASQMDDLSLLDDARYANTLVSRQSSIMMRQQQQPRRPQHRPTYSMPHLPAFREAGDYTVMWVSGECGISLRNFSRKDNKVGAQIAVLQHADGVTTGISNCRLGDQLVSINDEKVDTLRFREIVQKLKTTRRPISLGFRANASVQTSPRASTPPPSGFSNSTGGSRSSKLFKGGSFRSKLRRNKDAPSPSVGERHSVSGGSQPSSSGFFDDESSDIVHETIDHPGYDQRASHGTTGSNSGDFSAERPTLTSMRSSSSTLSDEVEVWCREQEEMHSDIIVLLTETVMRCEKLQQENLDQLQNLMQLSPSSPRPSESSSAASSYVGTEKNSKESNRAVELDLDALVPAVSSFSVTSPTA